MAREWSLRTLTNLKFRKLEKTLIEVYGCMPVDYKRVVRLEVRKGRPMAQPETYLGYMEKMLMEVYGCTPPDRQVIELDGIRNTKKTIVKIVREEGEPLWRGVHCA